MSELSLHMKKTVEASETNFAVMISSKELIELIEPQGTTI